MANEAGLMRATDLDSDIWNAIADQIGRSTSAREVYFGAVTKRDAVKGLVWVEDFGDLAIPLVRPKSSFAYYDTVPVTLPLTKHVIGSAGEPPFLNSWVNYDAVNFQAAAFYKDPFGIVHLQGLIKLGAMSSAAFTLPVGFRPTNYTHFATISASAFGGLRVVATTGDVIPVEGANNWFSLDGATFDSGVPYQPPTQIGKRDDPTNPAYQSNLVTPNVGELVIILDPWGVKRFPVCVGSIASRVGFWEGS